VSFQANKRPDSQTNMIVLRDFEPVLGAFDTGKLFEPTMVDLNLPGIQGVEGSLLNRQVQTAGRPVFRGAVFVDRPKNLDPAITLEMNQSPLWILSSQ